jgi:hypothetical protein
MKGRTEMDLMNKIKKYDNEEYRYEDAEELRMVLRGINTMKEMLEFAEILRHRKTLLSDIFNEEK